MPIVESIRRLERDGLVTVLPKWGATVKEWSREERLEAYVIRRALEGEAARFFVMRANADDKRRLVELSDRFDEFAAYDPVQCDEADIEFHLHIVRSTRFQRLYDLIENSKIETATLFGLCMDSVEAPDKRDLDYKKLIGCHKPVIDALLGKNPDMAAQAIWRHIDSVLAVLMTLEEEESYPKAAREPSAISTR
jgi:DNA-binding GntR family transcriptional regulator